MLLATCLSLQYYRQYNFHARGRDNGFAAVGAATSVVKGIVAFLTPGAEQKPWQYSSHVDVPLSPEEELALLQKRMEYIQAVNAARNGGPNVREPAPAPEPPAPVQVGNAATISEVQGLVSRYLDLYAQNDLEQLVPLYCPRVEFFDKGVVDRGYVRTSLKQYISRWPMRQRMLDGAPEVELLEGDECSVAYTYEWLVRRGSKQKTGRARDEYRVDLRQGSPCIAMERSRVLRRD